MRNIAGGIRFLIVGERPTQPVGEPIALGDGDLEFALQQAGQRWRSVANKTGSELGVEETLWHCATRMSEHIEVLLRGVQHALRVALEQRAQRGDIDCQRIDQSGSAGPRELSKRKLWVIGALAMELGIERVTRLGHQDIDEIKQLVLRGDPLIGHEGESPATVSRPLWIHAIVPPATLTMFTP